MAKKINMAKKHGLINAIINNNSIASHRKNKEFNNMSRSYKKI